MKNGRARESGVALIIVLLLMLVFTIIMLGFYFQTTGEQKIASSDRDNTVAFYAAQGGIENMSSDLAALFASVPSPTPTQITNLTGTTYQQSIPIYNNAGTLTSAGVTFPVYSITNLATPATTNPTTAACTPNTTSLCSTPGIIPGNGPLAGLEGLITPFLLTVVADGPNSSEVKMTRQVQEVAVPVFQYGIFSQTDLSFFAGPDFGFGGRTATNGNLFLAEGGGTLSLNDKVTAYLSIIRSQLSNGLATATTSYNTPVNVTISASGGCPTPTCPACTPSNGPPATCRALATTEGSVTGGPGSAANPNWQSLSMSTYGGYIRSGSTGVKQLNLALALAGASPIAMIQRPLAGENPASEIGGDRLFNQASVRILLSDSATQITNLPGVTATAPLQLTSALNSGSPATLPVDNCHPPIALSPGYTADHDYMSPAGTSLLGGYIKIEVQLNSNPGTWQDVTTEVLSTGISNTTVANTTMTALNTPTQANGGSLAASTTYYYFLTALGSWGESLQSPEVSKATTSTKKTLGLSWSALAGATGYRIYRGTSSGGETGYISVGAVTSYSDAGAALTAASAPTPCSNISILHLEEGIPGIAPTSTAATNFVPINIYDPREGEVRDSNNYTTTSLNGLMNLLEVDVGNLQLWLANRLCKASTVPTSCSSGALALNNSGYILYVSDRRGNCNQAGTGPCSGTVGTDTGEFGNEDLINPSSGTGTPNNALDTGEDVDGDGVFRKYGATPRYLAIDASSGSPWPAFIAAMPTTNPAFERISSASTCTAGGGCVAQKNSVVLFRHAVRLVDGTLGNLPPYAAATLATCPNAQSPATFPSQGGFSVASENPVYIQGDYNASASVGAFSPDPSGNCHVPAAVMADAVTLLSNSWNDAETFANPTNVGNRPGTSTTWYRVAIIAGKNVSFPLPTFTNPAAPPQDFGTDGGTHNFLRYIENWGSTLNYLGSMCSFYYARQATGVYKCCSTVYNAPTRAYTFDTDFTNITSLPPGTPRFTDVNALSYQQAIQATQ